MAALAGSHPAEPPSKRSKPEPEGLARQQPLMAQRESDAPLSAQPRLDVEEQGAEQAMPDPSAIVTAQSELPPPPHAYFERQVKRWCGMHCLNALEQRAAFDKKQLKGFADQLFVMCAAIEEDTAAQGRRGRAGRVRAPASHIFGSSSEGNLDVQVSTSWSHPALRGRAPRLPPPPTSPRACFRDLGMIQQDLAV